MPILKDDESFKILTGDCLTVLRTLPDESVHTCITSPPYWGLRDYGGDGIVWGGNPDCDHDWEGYTRPSENTRNNDNSLQLKSAYWEPQEQACCEHCDAWFGQLGLEPTPQQYTANITEIFREVRRVLKPEGTLWLNLGDTYYNHRGANNRRSDKDLAKRDTHQRDHHNIDARPNEMEIPGLKSKDLIGIPWRVAFALQQDGWWLRQDIIWAKPNCMPESVRDRCTKNHEYIFLLTKSKHYYYDCDAIREPNADAERTNYTAGKRTKGGEKENGNPDRNDNDLWERSKDFVPKGRNKRSVWWVSPKPYKGAHFAVYPPELIEPCILAGTSEQGCCGDCNAPYERTVGKACSECNGFIPNQANRCPDCNYQNTEWKKERGVSEAHRSDDFAGSGNRVPRKNKIENITALHRWGPTCDCSYPSPVPCVVLDPFLGSGTTIAVALANGRKAVGIELNPDYVVLAEERIGKTLAELGQRIGDERDWI